MIISSLLNLLVSLLGLCFSGISIPSLPSSATETITEMFTYIETASGILANYTDLAYLLTLFGVLLVVDVGIKIYHFAMWIIRKIPMLGIS